MIATNERCDGSRVVMVMFAFKDKERPWNVAVLVLTSERKKTIKIGL